MSDSMKSLAPMLVVFSALMGLMYLGFDRVLAHRNNPNLEVATGVDAPTRVVLKRNPAGRYMAPGTINGQPVTFLIDTGADNVAVPARIARRVGLTELAPILVNTAGGVVKAYDTEIERMMLGGIQLNYVEGSINPSMTGDYVLLGMSFLRHVDFSKRGDELIIEPPSTY
ncbi:MAG: retropepsin-like aspartic protease [Pseudomonadota bacterium]